MFIYSVLQVLSLILWENYNIVLKKRMSFLDLIRVIFCEFCIAIFLNRKISWIWVDNTCSSYTCVMIMLLLGSYCRKFVVMRE